MMKIVNIFTEERRDDTFNPKVGYNGGLAFTRPNENCKYIKIMTFIKSHNNIGFTRQELMASACGYAGDSNWNNTLWASMGHANFVIYNYGHLKNYELVNFDFDLTKKGFDYLEEFGF